LDYSGGASAWIFSINPVVTRPGRKGMVDVLVTLGTILTDSYRGWILVLALLTAWELANPQGEQRAASRVRGLIFWTLFIPVASALHLLLAGTWSALGVKPLLSLPLFAPIAFLGPVAALLAVLIAWVINDFFFYWCHRIQHRFLWRWHAVHHSIRDLNAVNSYHHPSEALMSLILYSVPTSLIVTDAAAAVPLIGLVMWLQIVWIHSPTRANLGPLRVWFVDNRYHRIHHSLEERHFDRNFGAFTTLWDRLFGTYYAPQPDEWPDVGLAEVGEPGGIRDWLDQPLRYPAPTEAEPTAA
jgi:sterol desaturase/sphingolipid hydroxylase (fatty acid hydroxylase superfamily)